MPRILVVEDEKKVARFVRRALEEEEYEVDVAHDGEQGLAMATAGSYDLIILDVMLPRMDGMEVMRALRGRHTAIPTLMLTAKTATEDKVAGLDSGADDYLTKPFAVVELLARVRSLLRRGGRDRGTILSVADLELDTVKHVARRGGRIIELTAKEYALLEFLLRNKGRVVNRSSIAERIWNYTFDPGTNIIDVYVNHLRNKIDGGTDRKLIHTVRGVGYGIREE
ncbi:MAG: response regulator transcription factor [Bacteroidota bacterium]